jgi:hypothetical protein
MPSLQDVRSGKPGHTPDQSIYAEYACAEFGLAFQDIDGGTGLVFNVASGAKTLSFGAGRCSWSPQNNSTAAAGLEQTLDAVLPKGERWEIPGRMNLSAGGTMVLETLGTDSAAAALAQRAAGALGLRVAAVDLFTDIESGAEVMRVIEVNSNPSIRLLEDSNRDDLILKTWQHTFSAMGLLGV